MPVFVFMSAGFAGNYEKRGGARENCDERALNFASEFIVVGSGVLVDGGRANK